MARYTSPIISFGLLCDRMPKCHFGRFPSASLRYGIFFEGVVGLELDLALFVAVLGMLSLEDIALCKGDAGSFTRKEDMGGEIDVKKSFTLPSP